MDYSLAKYMAKNAVRYAGERHMVVSKVILAPFATERVEKVERGIGVGYSVTYSADVEGRLEKKCLCAEDEKEMGWVWVLWEEGVGLWNRGVE